MKVFVKAGVNYNVSVGNNKEVTSTYTSSTSGVKNGNYPFQSTSNRSVSPVLLKGSYYVPLFSARFICGRSKLEFSYWPATNIEEPTTVEPTAYIGGTVSNPTFKVGTLGLLFYFSLFQTK